MDDVHDIELGRQTALEEREDKWVGRHCHKDPTQIKHTTCKLLQLRNLEPHRGKDRIEGKKTMGSGTSEGK